MALKDSLLAAARAHSIPEGQHGLWTIKKFSLAKPLEVSRPKFKVTLPPGTYTNLHRATLATLHDGTPGELVMHDTPDELNSHLQFMLQAHGDVLITGLGLGCVARGTAANPAVRSVTVIERDPSVLELVARHMPPGITIIHADALEWTKQNTRKFDCAWHDLWTDTSEGEPHLQRWHAEIIGNLHESVPVQGAWAFPRNLRRRQWGRSHVI